MEHLASPLMQPDKKDSSQEYRTARRCIMNTRNTRGKLVHQRILHNSDEVLYLANSCNSTQMTLSEDSWQQVQLLWLRKLPWLLSSEQSLQRERNISREPQLFQVQNLPSGTVVPVPLRTHIKSPFVFLYLAHLPLQNVKNKAVFSFRAKFFALESY